MNATIDWSLSAAEYQDLFQRIPRSTLLQDAVYGIVCAKRNHQRVRWGLIRLDGQKAGIVQILEAGLLNNAIHAVLLDRGPLWLPGYGSDSHRESFFAEFGHQFPRRPGRKRRIIPEWSESPQACESMARTGFTRRPRPGYQTFWIDLRPPEESLRKAMRQKWRNSLNKAEKAGIEVVWETKAANISDIISVYKLDRSERRYGGASPDFVQNLAGEYQKTRGLMVGRALWNGNFCSAIILLCHGRAATYQLGWNSASGREVSANALLLWKGCEKLKARGIDDLDLGGFNEEAEGLRRFKAGLGGTEISLAGQYL
ncbi:MAG: GNAT family N-acetyltransferase [Alphaproteobacteria bacterium]|nr:GNAT family N-acetyltransferase [Alphaproteobacteria bacterium]